MNESAPWSGLDFCRRAAGHPSAGRCVSARGDALAHAVGALCDRAICGAGGKNGTHDE